MKLLYFCRKLTFLAQCVCVWGGGGAYICPYQNCRLGDKELNKINEEQRLITVLVFLALTQNLS
jgi:hypothetical protein